MKDRTKLVIAGVLFAIVGIVVASGSADSLPDEIAALVLTSAGAFLAYDAWSALRVLRRRRAWQAAVVPPARITSS